MIRVRPRADHVSSSIRNNEANPHCLFVSEWQLVVSARIPIVISAPGVTNPGSKSDALIETVDLYPTLAELAGLPAPAGPQPIDGDSFVNVLKGRSSDVGMHAFHCYPRRGRLGRAVRTARYRLVEWKPFGGTQPPEYELYDYEADPGETKNLAAEQPEVVKRLAAILAIRPAAKPPHRSRTAAPANPRGKRPPDSGE